MYQQLIDICSAIINAKKNEQGEEETLELLIKAKLAMELMKILSGSQD